MHRETRQLVAWSFYDWANNGFSTLIQTFVFAAYFTRRVAADEATGSAQWGMAIGLAGLVVAVSGPILGAIADQTGRRKPWIAGFTLLCVVATGLLWLVRPSPESVPLALVLVAVGTIGAELAVVFYNAMLPDLAAPERIGRWSGWAWGLGYAGGLLCLAVALVGFVDETPWFSLDRESGANVRATFVLAAAWYLVFALPLLIVVRERTTREPGLAEAIASGWHQIVTSVRHVRRYAPIVRFLVARMIYIDGLATLFAFGGVYAAGTFAMSESQVLTFGIALNVTAGIGAFAFGWIDDRIGAKPTILVSLVGLMVPGTVMLLVDSQAMFWACGLVLGIFVGPVQAASRSFLARCAPQELRNEMFGLYALSGKATAFLGPLLVGWLSYWAGSQRVGMSAIIVLLAVGLGLMLTVPAAPQLGAEHARASPAPR